MIQEGRSMAKRVQVKWCGKDHGWMGQQASRSAGLFRFSSTSQLAEVLAVFIQKWQSITLAII